jgi:hypothetical protein
VPELFDDVRSRRACDVVTDYQEVRTKIVSGCFHEQHPSSVVNVTADVRYFRRRDAVPALAINKVVV